jgi:hypothetical protein
MQKIIRRLHAIAQEVSAIGEGSGGKNLVVR